MSALIQLQSIRTIHIVLFGDNLHSLQMEGLQYYKTLLTVTELRLLYGGWLNLVSIVFGIDKLVPL